MGKSCCSKTGLTIRLDSPARVQFAGKKKRLRNLFLLLLINVVTAVNKRIVITLRKNSHEGTSRVVLTSLFIILCMQVVLLKLFYKLLQLSDFYNF